MRSLKISNTIADEFPSEHIDRLKKHNTQSFLIHMTLAFTLLVSLLSANAGNQLTLSLWVGILIIVGFVRLHHNSVEIKPESVDVSCGKPWVNRYLLLTTLMSSLWGAAGIFLFSHEPVVQATLMLLLVTILISTLPLLLASKAAFFVQFITILAPLTLSIGFNLPAGKYLVLSVCLAALAATIVFASNYLYQTIAQLQETQARLQAQVDTDQLTQLANRRAFDTAFKREWRRSTREQKPIALLIIDVDNFKLYNDTFGHVAGDECLKKIATAIQSSAHRPNDVAARVGGEEFAILLPDSSKKGAFTVAERIQKSVGRLDIAHPAGVHQTMTVSIGISSCLPVFPGEEISKDVVYPAMLFNTADYAMYQAKQEGKDAIVLEACGMHSTAEPLGKKRTKPLAEEPMTV